MGLVHQHIVQKKTLGSSAEGIPKRLKVLDDLPRLLKFRRNLLKGGLNLGQPAPEVDVIKDLILCASRYEAPRVLMCWLNGVMERETGGIDKANGRLLVVAHENDAGGRSVAIPGIMVVKNQRVDVYYGNLFLNENFNKLLINSIEWAMGNSRFTRLGETLEEKINEFNSIQEELRIAAEETREGRRTRRTYFLMIFWAVGLGITGLILVKMVLVPQE